MAHIRKEVIVEAPPEAVWSALADWGALHERLVPGFVVETEVDESGARTVTFFSGNEVREILVSRDDQEMRLAWSVVDGPYTHHNGVAQVFAEPGEGSRFVWTADLLPEEAAAVTATMMGLGVAAVKESLEGRSWSPPASS